MQPKVEATPFTDSDDKSPKVTMHTLKLVSDVKSSSIHMIMYMLSSMVSSVLWMKDFCHCFKEAAAHGVLRLLFTVVMLRRKAISMLRTNRKSETLLAFRAKSL